MAVHSLSVLHGDLSGVCVTFTRGRVTLLTCHSSSQTSSFARTGVPDIADFGLTELGGSTFATSFHERGTIWCMSPELLDIRMPGNELEEEASHVLATTRSDVYSFGGLMLQVCGASHQSQPQSLRYMTRRTGSDWQCALVVHVVSKGITPTRPSDVLVAKRRSSNGVGPPSISLERVL